VAAVTATCTPHTESAAVVVAGEAGEATPAGRAWCSATVSARIEIAISAGGNRSQQTSFDASPESNRSV
jgi:hypothetical protein